MTAAGLDLVIGAKVDDAINGLKQVQTQLVKTEQEATKFSEKAKTNFTGLTRVIQDLPFGFVAISNNLEQLLPAAGGLGLAFSALVSGITFAQVGLRNWVHTGKDAKDTTDEFAKALRSAEASAFSTGIKLQEFVSIARDNTRSLAERNYALTEANKLMGEHGEKLTMVNINTAAATAEINKYTQALIAQAVANKYSDKAADLIIKQTEASKAYGESVDDLNNAIKAGTKSVNPFADLKTVKAYYDNIQAAIEYKKVTQELHDTVTQANDAIEKSTNLFADLGTKTKDDTKAHKEKVKTLQEELDLLRKMLYAGKQYGLYTSALLEKAPYDPNKIGPSGIGLSLTQQQAEIQLTNMRETLQKAGVKVFSAQGILTGVDLLNDKEVQANYDKFSEHTQALAQLISTDLGGAFDSVFQAIEQGKNVFASLGGAIKKMVLQLVEAVAEAAALAFIFSFLPGGQAFSLAGVKSIFGGLTGIKGFATGGIVTQPTLAIVGESGPERITPLGYGGAASNAIRVVVEGQISGQNIVLAQRRTEAINFNTF